MSGMLRKKELVTIITPIPGFIPRQLAIDILHSHSEVITLNPLVLSHKAIEAPRDAASDEYYSTWYEITERIQYIPGFGKMGSGKISFNGCFHDMPWGLQAHIYAPMSIDMRYKYRIAGNQPGVEPPEPMEIGLAALGAPSDGLYLREDVEVKCSIAVMSFVKSQLKAASKLMVQRIIKKAELVDAGVLHAMIENGKLKTINPADRSKTMHGSPNSASTPQTSSSPQQQQTQSGQNQSAQDNSNSNSAGSNSNSQSQKQQLLQSPASPSIPYTVPRPQSFSPMYNPRPGSAGVAQQYQNPSYPGYPSYGANYGSAHPGHVSYSGVPGGFVQPHMQHPSMYGNPYGQQPYPSDQQSYAVPYGVPGHTATPAAPFPVEMPGDYYHAQTIAGPGGQQPQPQPQPQQLSTSNTPPRSNRDSDILSTGQWSASSEYSQTSAVQGGSPALSGSRPASTASDSSANAGGAGGVGGYRSPGLDKGFSSDLATHRETAEEYRAEALQKLDPSATQSKQPGYAYNPADYGRPVYGRN